MTRYTAPLDVEAIAEKWINQCGSCDLGLPEYGCNHPDEDYRPVMLTLVREVQRLRELFRWESGQRRKGLSVVESVPDGLHYAALLVRAIGTEGGEEHDDLLREASQRLKALADACSYLLAERQRDRLIVQAAYAWREMRLGLPGTPKPESAALIAAVDATLGGGS